jgi:hypothetical protein
MADTVHKITSLDVYRDGGSLSMSFLDGDGVVNELILKVDNSASVLSGIYTIYCRAILAKFAKSVYVSPVTGISMQKTDLSEDEISWSNAKEILEKAKPLIPDFQSSYLWVFDSMLTIANNSQHQIRYS